jgi:hypothetical protein
MDLLTFLEAAADVCIIVFVLVWLFARRNV